jgi:hypothetical protein
MPSAAHILRAALASAAVVLSLAIADPAAASGPLSGLGDTVSDVTNGVSDVTEGLGQTVESVGGRSGDSGRHPRPAPTPADEQTEPSEQRDASAQRSAPVVRAVSDAVEDTADTAARVVRGTARRARAATDAVEPVVDAAAKPVRSATRSVEAVLTRTVETVERVAEPVLATATELAEPVLATVRTVAEPVLGAVGTVVHRTVAPALEVVRPVTEILTPHGPQAGASADGARDVPGAVGASALPPAPPGTTERPSRQAKPPALERTGVPGVQPGAPGPAAWSGATSAPSASQQIGSGSSAAPPARPRDAVPVGSSSAAGGSGSAFFTGFAAVALLVALAAPGLGRRLKLRPALIRPPLFVSPPERPG